MSQPPPFSVSFNFANYAALHPSAPFQPSALDNELANIEDTLDGVLQNLALIQRDDGALANGVVTVDSLGQDTINLIGDWNPRGTWATSTNYAVRDMVTPTGTTVSYVCAVAHTSGATFNADYALGYWQPVNGVGNTSIVAANFLFSQGDVILASPAFVGGPGIEIACTTVARSLLDDATTADMRTTLGLGSASSPTFTALTVGSIVVSGLTPSAFVYSDGSSALASTAAPTDGQLLIGDTGGVPLLGSIAGTANQVTVTNGAGTITLSLPQSIDTAATPTFATVNLTNLSQGAVVFVGSSSALSQDINNLVWDDSANSLGVRTSAPNTTFAVDINGAMRSVAYYSALASTDGITNFLVKRTTWGGSVFGDGTSAPAVDVFGFRGQNGTNNGLYLGRDMALAWQSNTPTSAWDGSTVADVFLYRDGANAIAQRNGATAQSFRVYNTWANAGVDYERANFVWSGNTLLFLTQQGGTGSAREMAIGTSGAATLSFRTNNTNQWQVNSSGVFIAATDNTLDIGASGANRPRTIYPGTSIVFPTGGLLQWSTDLSLQRGAANVLEQVNGTNNQEQRWYGTFTSTSDYHRVAIRVAKTTLASVSGASVTATNLIPDGAFVLGVTSRITVALGGGGGTTGYQVGDGSDADRWGAVGAITAGSGSDNRDATANFTGAFTAANNVVVTAVGGNFNGTGSIEICVFYIACEFD